MIKLYNFIFSLLCILLVSCNSKKNQLDKAISVSEEDLNLAYAEGQKEAVSDIKQGLFIIKRWGMPPVEKYENELKEKYNITIITVYGYFVSMPELKRIEGYNSISLKEIRNKYGNRPFAIIKYVTRVDAGVHQLEGEGNN